VNVVGLDSGQLCEEVEDSLMVTDGNNDAAKGATGLNAADVTNSSGGSAFAHLHLVGLI